MTASIPLLTNPASVGATTQIGDTLYALIPPDGNNQATALVMYQPDNSVDPSTSDEVNNAVQDALNHNNWFAPNYSYVIRNMSPSDQPLPAGTQFWVCSSTGFVTLTDNGSISVAGPPAPTVDPSDPAITGLASLIAGVNYRNPELEIDDGGRGFAHWCGSPAGLFWRVDLTAFKSPQ